MSNNLPILENPGYCPACDQETTFIANNSWLRDHYICSNCGSIPRERALMHVINSYFPNWRELIIHESSPVYRGATVRLDKECKNYVPSQYFPGYESGSTVEGILCENLEALSFQDDSVDIHITQDVIEHVYNPKKVFKEIARTLRPGGAHIFTVPLVKKSEPSKMRINIGEDSRITYLEPPTYHGNPISNEGSLVTVDWGYDICRQIFEACGLFTYLVYIDDISKGIRAEYIEVLVTIKHSDFNRNSIP